MKYFSLLLLLLPFQLFSQTKSIQMTDEKGEIVFIKQDKRVKIITLDRNAHFGKVKFLDDDHIILKSDTIAMANINKIQRRSVGKAIVSTVVIGLSVIAIPVGTILLITDTASAGVLIAAGHAGVAVGILISPLGKKYTKKHWHFAIVNQ